MTIVLFMTGPHRRNGSLPRLRDGSGRRRAIIQRYAAANKMMATGQAEEAYRYALEAFREAEQLKDELLCARGLAILARLAWITGHFREVTRLLRVYFRGSTACTSRFHFDAMLAFAHVLATQGLPHEALTILDKAERLPVASTLDSFAMLLQERAYLFSHMALEDRCISAYEMAACLVRNRDNPQLAAMTLNNFAAASRNVGQIERALDLHEEAVRALDPLPVQWRIQYCLASKSLSYYYGGDLWRARDALKQSLQWDGNNFQVELSQAFTGLLIGVAMEDNDLIAQFSGMKWLQAAFRCREAHRIATMSAAMHRFLIQANRTVEAEKLLKRAIRALNNPEGCTLLCLQVAQYGGIDTVSHSLELNAQLPADSRVRLGMDLLLRSRIQRLSGEPQATREADRAALVFEQLKWPLHQAVALELAERFGEASKLYASSGATADAKRLRGIRWRVGRPRRISGQLTKREWEVARLSTSGLPNKEIAVRIGVHPSTVEFHMKNILRSLNVTSRYELRDILTELQ